MTSDSTLINTKKAVGFLKHFRPGTHNIVAIEPDSGKIDAITRPVNDTDLYKFIDRYNGERNLYFMVNEPVNDAPDTKLTKKHVKNIHGVWLDADPDKTKPFKDERTRIETFAADLRASKNPPTYIVDSGGGFQAFWMLPEPVQNTEHNQTGYEALSRGLANQYNTDNVHNIDRIMRIPYTLNIPGKKKPGRTKTPAKVYSVNARTPQGKRYTLNDLRTFITPKQAAETTTEIIDKDFSLTEAKQPLSSQLKDKIKATNNQKLFDTLTGKHASLKPSRSELDFTLAIELKYHGFTLQEFANIACNFKHGSIYAKPHNEQSREIIRTYNRAQPTQFNDLPKDYIEKINNQTNPLTAAKQAETINDGDKPKRLKLIELGTDDGKIAGLPLLKGLIDQNTITVMYGQSNVGKSFVATDMAGHIAAGKDWGTYKLKEQFSVLYICAEAGLSFGKRGMALKRRLGIKQGTPLNEFPFAYVAQGVNFLQNKDDRKDVVLLAQSLEEQSGFECGLIVVDTLATTFGGGNENSSEDMGKFIENMKWIQEMARCAVLVVHHSGKDQAAGARGHSSLRAATDTELEVLSDKRGERYHRSIKTRKQRDGESDTLIEFGLAVDELWKDEDGDPVTTCHVVLESDSEFSDVTPSLLESLETGELLAVKAAFIYYKEFGNPDKVTLNNKNYTSKQIISLILDDLRCEKNKRKVLNDVGVSWNEIAFLEAKKWRGWNKYLETRRNDMEQKGVFILNEQYQIDSEYLERVERAWNE
jgi:hypothetical protein